MKKALKIAGIVLGGLVALIIVALLVFMLIQPLLYKPYYDKAEKEFPAAGLSDGVVPQGFAYDAEAKLYLQVGYMADGESASRIYLADEEGNSRFVELLDTDGNPYLGHTGGIAVSGDRVWMANDGDIEANDNCVWAISREELLDESITQIALTECFFPESRSACVAVYDGLLWVGEFYDPEKYPTAESHHLKTPSGETNPSLICGYTIDHSQPAGIASTIPAKLISVREKLQGFAFNEDGEMALSTSYGLANSHIYFYESVLDNEPDTSLKISGADVPVWTLDNSRLTADLTVPPMSEELVAKDGRLYILYESACNKYIFGNFMRGRQVYSYPF